MRILFDRVDDEKIIADWNEACGVTCPILTKDELCTVYEVEDFGFSKRTNKFWVTASDPAAAPAKKFTEMLAHCKREDLDPNGLYFSLREDWPTEQIRSFRHWYDRCSPINVDYLANSFYFDKDVDLTEAERSRITTFYSSLKTLFNYENYTA